MPRLPADIEIAIMRLSSLMIYPEQTQALYELFRSPNNLFNGFPELCALAFFLGGQVMKMSNGVPVEPNGLLTVDITERDISYFPFLHKLPRNLSASTLWIAPSSSLSTDEIKKFEKLDENPIFYKKCYFIFLRIVCLPSHTISDSLEHAFSNNTFFMIDSDYRKRQAQLKLALLFSSKFITWFNALSIDELKLFFKHFSTEDSLSDAKKLFSAFCISHAIKQVHDSFSFLPIIQDELSAHNELYASFICFYGVLSDLFASLDQLTECSAYRINSIVAAITNVIVGFESLSVYKNNQCDILPRFIQGIKNILQSLRSSIKKIEVIDADAFEMIDAEPSVSCQFIAAPWLDSYELANVAMQWLCDESKVKKGLPSNKCIVLRWIDQIYFCDDGKNGMTSDIFSTVSSASSRFFSALSNPSFLSQQKMASGASIKPDLPLNSKLISIREKINQADQLEKFISALCELLECEDKKAILLHKKFAIKLISQVLCERSIRPAIALMQHETRFFTYVDNVLSKQSQNLGLMSEAASVLLGKIKIEALKQDSHYQSFSSDILEKSTDDIEGISVSAMKTCQ